MTGTSARGYWATQVRAALERARRELCPCGSGVPRSSCLAHRDEDEADE